MDRNLTEYKQNPVFSEVDRRAFREIAKEIGKANLTGAARSLYWWIHNEGWRFSPYQFYEKYASATFDERHGTDTRTRVNISDMQIQGPNASHGVYYQASPVASTRRILRRLGVNFRDFTFVDFGSGKGRTLLVASEFPFKRVIGVEFGAELHDCARKNISAYRHSKASSVESILADATTFDLPNDNLVLYFFNPFNEYILGKVMQNICSSLKVMPRNVYLIYRYLPDIGAISSAEGFRLLRDWRRYRIYQWSPPASGDRESPPQA